MPAHGSWTGQDTLPEGFDWIPRAADGSLLPRIQVEFDRADGTRSKPYTYAWGGEVPVQIGDRVRTPRPYVWMGWRTDVGTVTRLGSGYEGPVLTLTRLATP
jgi:hypothetical protein